jgi:hypothetical protein
VLLTGAGFDAVAAHADLAGIARVVGGSTAAASARAASS